jgi:hypothetical protein
MADLSPEASNAFKLPIFEISILEDDLLTYLMTIRAKVVIFGIKPILMKCRFVLVLT